MLLWRSICIEALLLSVLCLVNAQNYGSEYESSEGDGDDHSSYTDGGSDHPDYSKYYKVDESAPLIATPNVASSVNSEGFGPGPEFSSFFSSPHFDFGASSTKEQVQKPALPLITNPNPPATGFVTPNDFQSGFSNYQADPFSKDYFEQAKLEKQKSEAAEEDEEETRPGPNYVSHRVPANLAKINLSKVNLKGYGTEVHDLNETPHKYRKSYNTDYNNEESNNEENDKSAEDKEEYNEDEEPKSTKANNYEFDVKHAAPFNLPDFNAKDNQEVGGKSSYDAPNSPYVPNFYTKYTQAPTPTLSPYQKYSFQPVTDSYGLKSGYLEALQSTATPFNPAYSKIAEPSNYETQPSEHVPQQLNNKKCKKVNKQVSQKDITTGRFKRQAMDCYVCQDPKSGANYEQCSYTSEPNEKSYFIGKSEKYSKPKPTEHHRYRRYAPKYEKEEEKEEYVNPYDRVKANSHKYYSKPDEFASYSYNAKDFGPVEEYRFGPEYFDDGAAEEKSESEVQSEKLVKEGENCKKTKKNNMTCMVCKNPKTGGNYEQCSYTSAPAEKKYAYVRERKFDENENPIEDKVVESSEPKETVQRSDRYRTRQPKNSRAEEAEKYEESRPQERQRSRARNDKERYSQERQPESRRRASYNEEREPEESKHREVEKSSYEVPDHFVESTTRRQKSGLRGLDPELYGSADSSEVKRTKEKEPFEKEIEEYHFKIFNEESESKNKEKRVRPEGRARSEGDYNVGTKKDVEEVLAEFAKRDRSNCKKAHKNGMTCYLCTDKKGIKNEECMFVSESQPKASHIAYHEVKKLNEPQSAEEEEEAESKQKPVTKEVESDALKRKRFFKKATTESPVDVAAAPSREVSSKVRATTPIPSPSAGKSRVPRQYKRTKNISNKDAVVAESKRTEVRTESQEPTLAPLEYVAEGEDGAFTAETKPVYSKTLGHHLPKYMLDKSEHEQSFDDFSKVH